MNIVQENKESRERARLEPTDRPAEVIAPVQSPPPVAPDIRAIPPEPIDVRAPDPIGERTTIEVPPPLEATISLPPIDLQRVVVDPPRPNDVRVVVEGVIPPQQRSQPASTPPLPNKQHGPVMVQPIRRHPLPAHPSSIAPTLPTPKPSDPVPGIQPSPAQVQRSFIPINAAVSQFGSSREQPDLAYLAKLAELEARIRFLEDDVPEQMYGGGGVGFTGVMLVGRYFAPVDILDEVDTAARNFLCVDMRALNVYWSAVEKEEWYVDCIPVGAVTGLINYPLVPHYVAGEED